MTDPQGPSVSPKHTGIRGSLKKEKTTPCVENKRFLERKNREILRVVS